MNEIATIATEQPPKLPTLASGGRVAPIVPADFEGAWRIANAVCVAGMAPKGLDRPEQAMVAILHGLEVGLTPMAALQSIAVVNGRPAIWGDGALGLVRGSGVLEYIEEFVEGETAVCVAKRKGEPKPIRREFSVADARAAGLWGKTGPWTQYPKRMLAMRARGFTLRDGFADVLRGLHIAEEAMDIPARDVTPASPAPARPATPQAALDAFAGPAIEHDAQGEPELPASLDRRGRGGGGETASAAAETQAEPDLPGGAELAAEFDPETWLADLDADLSDCSDEAALGAVWDARGQAVIERGDVFPPDRQRAADIYAKHLSRFVE